MTYQPKGGMCATCLYRGADCSKLPFDKMPVHSRDGDAVIVICKDYRRVELPKRGVKIPGCDAEIVLL